jgi:hypothetical protein
MKLLDYLENIDFQNNIQILSEGILDFPSKEIFQTFNSLNREDRVKIMNIFNKEINKALSSEEKRSLLTKVKQILVKKNPDLMKKFADL